MDYFFVPCHFSCGKTTFTSLYLSKLMLRRKKGCGYGGSGDDVNVTYSCFSATTKYRTQFEIEKAAAINSSHFLFAIHTPYFRHF